ncbi:MAG: transcriptional repressor LexA [Planctomycetota bacterium]
MTKLKLTDRQKHVYDLIQSLISQRGYGPTVREIGEHFGIKSPNGVMCHLRALERKGLIVRKANKSRAIELTGEHSRSVTGLPLAGMVLDQPSPIDRQSTDAIDLGRSLVAADRFVVQVSGDALTGRGILDGDYVVIDTRNQVTFGDLALVEFVDGQCVLRYWKPGSDQIRLEAANEFVQPMMVRDASVIGVATSVVRLDLMATGQ